MRGATSASNAAQGRAIPWAHTRSGAIRRGTDASKTARRDYGLTDNDSGRHDFDAGFLYGMKYGHLAAGVPAAMIAALECTAQWLEHGNDPKAAAAEIRACLAKLDAAPSAPTTADDHAARLDDADIDTIAESMPGGLGSFMKQWGWRQFARAVEDEVVLNVSRALRAASGQSFQTRVQPWMLECFGPTIAADRIERNHRFLEEALELVQSLGCMASEAHQLVDYTFGRPIGEPVQEVGGVMVTLAALCLASELDMHAAGETELARISEPAMVLKIRAKQAAKPKHSPLPQAVAARAPYEWRDTGPLETDEGGAA